MGFVPGPCKPLIPKVLSGATPTWSKGLKGRQGRMGGGKGWEVPTPHVSEYLLQAYKPLTPKVLSGATPTWSIGFKGRQGGVFPRARGGEKGREAPPPPPVPRVLAPGPLQATDPQGPFGRYPYLVQRAQRQAGWGFPQGAGGGRGGKPQPPPLRAKGTCSRAPGPLTPKVLSGATPTWSTGLKGRQGGVFPRAREGGRGGKPQPPPTCQGYLLQGPRRPLTPQGPFGRYPYLVKRAQRQAGWGFPQGTGGGAGREAPTPPYMPRVLAPRVLCSPSLSGCPHTS